MFDYKLLEALTTIIEMKGFEKAATSLYITQSAISQRLKLLEEITGQILITRQNPPIATDLGVKLIKHFNQVKLLENEITKDITKNGKEFTTINVGINEDSLSTWFLKAVNSVLKTEKILLNLHVDDQDKTKQLLKDGVVSCCISSNPKPVQGCIVKDLGKMDYILVCTKEFFKTYFDDGISISNIKKAPAVLFNTKDDLHNKYLEKMFGKNKINYPAHYIPSAQKFMRIIEMGLGYGVIPQLQMNLSNNKNIIQMTNIKLSIDLYWHSWNIKSELFDTFYNSVLNFNLN